MFERMNENDERICCTTTFRSTLEKSTHVVAHDAHGGRATDSTRHGSSWFGTTGRHYFHNHIGYSIQEGHVSVDGSKHWGVKSRGVGERRKGETQVLRWFVVGVKFHQGQEVYQHSHCVTKTYLLWFPCCYINVRNLV